MPVDDPLAARRRRSVVATTCVVVLLLGLVVAKLLLMQVTQLLGERAWRAGDAVAAERYFEASGRVNVVERWIAPFNRGVASYGQHVWEDAASWFERSFEVAPASARCTVALNWAWSLEAAGDELDAAGEDEEAAERWRRSAAAVAQAVGCDEGRSSRQPEDPEPSPSGAPSSPAPEDRSSDADDSSERTGPSEQEQREQTERRVQEKRSGHGVQPRPEEDDPSSADRAEELSERNDEAARARQRDEDARQQGQSDGPRRTW